MNPTLENDPALKAGIAAIKELKDTPQPEYEMLKKTSPQTVGMIDLLRKWFPS